MKSQLSLFEPGEGDSVVALDAAPIAGEVTALATRLPSALRMGTMSWNYPGWIGLVYAAGTREKQLLHSGLTAYVKHPLLRTVEVDRTYYEPMSAQTYRQFAMQTPDDFCFVAKAHEDCTAVHFPQHARYGARAGQRNPRLLDVAFTAEQVVAPFVDGLGKKAGALIFQFSPFEVRSPQRFAEKLNEFLRQLPKGPIYAVEVRNAELLTEAYGLALADAGAVHCHNAWGLMPGVLEQQAKLPKAARRILVARWLNRPDDSYESALNRFRPFNQLVEEDVPRRDELARLTTDGLLEGNPALVFVSNNAEGCAPESLLRLARTIDALSPVLPS